MNRQVHAPLGESFFNLLGEHPLRSDLGKGHLLEPVASGLDDLDLDLVPLASQQCCKRIRLPQCQLRTAASNAQLHRRVSTLAALTESLSALSFSIRAE